MYCNYNKICHMCKYQMACLWCCGAVNHFLGRNKLHMNTAVGYQRLSILLDSAFIHTT